MEQIGTQFIAGVLFAGRGIVTFITIITITTVILLVREKEEGMGGDWQRLHSSIPPYLLSSTKWISRGYFVALHARLLS